MTNGASRIGQLLARAPKLLQLTLPALAWTLATFTCGATFGFYAAVGSAELLIADLEVGTGDRLVTRDTLTGLDWLDLTAGAYCRTQQGSTWTYYYCQRGANEWIADGWRYATLSEVCALFGTYAFGDPSRCSGGLDPTVINYFIGLFGVTQVVNAGCSGTRSRGLFDDETGGTRLGLVEMMGSDTCSPGIAVTLDAQEGVEGTVEGTTQFLVRPSPPECSDGVDNDGDGRIDFDSVTRADFPTFQSGNGDPGCDSPSSTTESPRCQDGMSNDGDQLVDFDGGQSILGDCGGVPGSCPVGVSDPEADGVANPDPQCLNSPFRDNEAQVVCGIGWELALVFPLVGALAIRRRSPREPLRPR